MMRRIKIPRFPLCSKCSNRGACARKSARISSCRRPIKTEAKSGPWFECDEAEVARQKVAVEMMLDDACAAFKGVRRKDLRVTNNGRIVWTPPSKAWRKRMSRNGRCKVVDCDHTEFGKFCEMCGAPFTTVTRERRLCDRCHDEACEALGVDYANCVARITEKREVKEVMAWDAMNGEEVRR